jgi:hypothetical protein
MEPFWAKLAARRLVLCIELSSGPSYNLAGYLGHLAALGRILARYPDLPCHIAMSPSVSFFGRDGHYDFPIDVLNVFRRDTVHLEAMFPITYGGVWEYPYPEAQTLIADMCNLVGAERLMWGSDMPNVERFCTYKQSLEYVKRYCTFLSAREMDMILGGTCAALYGIGAATQSATS